jgi:hypothetical protein
VGDTHADLHIHQLPPVAISDRGWTSCGLSADRADHESAPRWHVTYTEPHSIHGMWTSPPSCHATEADAQAYIGALTALAGPDAARRRTWTTTPCDGTCRR